MNKFKFRAECLHDVVELLKIMPVQSYQIRTIGVLDVEVEFRCEVGRGRVISYMDQIPDSHVMIQTLRNADEYTGTRYVEGEKFYRKCDCCGDGMDEGYYLDGEYACSKECLDKMLTQEEQKELRVGVDDSDYFWTDWYGDEEDYQYIFTNGELKEIEN